MALEPLNTALQPWQERVVEERKELVGKHANLTAFLDRWKPGDTPTADFVLLVRQHTAMTVYLEILDERIKGFNNATRT